MIRALLCAQWLKLGGFLLIGSMASACGAGGEHTLQANAGALCDARNATPPTFCGEACSESNSCPLGGYCTPSGQCTADCDTLAGTGCGNGQACGVNGQCMSASDDTPIECASVKLSAQPKTPNIVLLLDRSGSMVQAFGAKSKWETIKDLLIGTPQQRAAGGGILHKFNDKARFGLAMYANRESASSPDPGMCVLLTPTSFESPKLNAYSSISATYAPTNPQYGTPTGQAIDNVVGKLAAVDPAGDPTILLLATDGEPTDCNNGNEGGAGPRNASITAVTNAKANKGILTYVIGVATDADTNEHLDKLAAAGSANGQGKAYSATNSTALSNALDQIISGQLSCVAPLSASVDLAQACSGKVTINPHAIGSRQPAVQQKLTLPFRVVL